MQTIDILTDGPVSGFTKGVIASHLPVNSRGILETQPQDRWIESWKNKIHHYHLQGGVEHSYLVIVHPTMWGGINLDTAFRYIYRRYVQTPYKPPSPVEDVELLLLAQNELRIDSNSMAVAQGLIEYYTLGLQLIRDDGAVDNFISLTQGSRIVVIEYHRY